MSGVPWHIRESVKLREKIDMGTRTETETETGTGTMRPDYYGGESNPYEAIKVIQAHNLNFCFGNVIKYVLRAGKKADALEDLKKARQYIDFEIARLDSNK